MQAPARLRVVLFLAVSSEAQTARAGDKVSMEQQETLGRQWATDNAASVIHVLKVDGFSRSETDVVTALEEFRNQGVTAYDQLRAMWTQKPLSFDVLWVYVDGRLGRSTSLYVYVVENTIAAGARVWRHQGGWIDASNKRMAMALGSIAATSDIDRLRDMRVPALEKRAREGKPVIPVDPMTHRRLRDDRGRSVEWAVKEDYRYALERAADHLLAGLGWLRIAKALNDEGIPTAKGKRWSGETLRQLFYSPFTWGNSARYFDKQIGLWAFDADEPLPENTQIARDAFPAYWTGERATLIQSELRRRILHGKGKAFPDNRPAFSGLLLCAGCGRPMIFHKWPNGTECYRCKTNTVIRATGNDWQACDCKPLSIKVDELVSHLTPYIENLIQRGDTSWWKAPLDDMTDRLDLLNDEIKKVETLIAGLMRQLATTPDVAQGILKQEIDTASRRLETMLTNRETWSRESYRQNADTAALAVAVRGIRLSTNAAAFWQQGAHEVNKALHALLGKGNYIGIHDGAVIGIVRRRKG